MSRRVIMRALATAGAMWLLGGAVALAGDGAGGSPAATEPAPAPAGDDGAQKPTGNQTGDGGAQGEGDKATREGENAAKDGERDPRKDPYSAERYIKPQHPGLKVGTKAPDVAVTDYDGKEISIASMCAERPLVLVFVQGGWCTACANMMTAWQARLSQLDHLGVSLVMVSPQKQTHIDAAVDAYHLEYPMVCDREGRVSRAFDVMNVIDNQTAVKFKNHNKFDVSELNAYATWDVPCHAAFVIDTDGTIVYAKAFWQAALVPSAEDIVDWVRAAVNKGTLGAKKGEQAETAPAKREDKAGG